MLYVARDEATSVVKLRARVPNGPLSMCKVRPARRLKVLDLVNGFRGINPFTTSEETLFWDVEVVNLLERFALELSQPVQSDDDPQEYRTTQKLCAAVRLAGYDGILYGSTRLDGGVNLVLFSPADGVIGESWRVD